METEFASATSGGEEGYEAGRSAAERAVGDLTTDAVDFCQVFCSPGVGYAAAVEGVRSVIGDDPELIGCAATGIFTETGRIESGVGLAVVAGDRIEFHTGIGTGLSQSTQRAIRDARKGLSEADGDLPYRSALVLYDSLASDGEELAQRIRRKLGARVPFAGGAASDDYRLESTPVFCNDRIEDDAVVVATVDSAAQAHVVDNHGHEPISEPVEVTSSEGRLLRELDGRPAFEVWKDAVRPHAAEMFGIDIDDLDPEDPEMLQMTGVFEFGIDQGETYKMRACIETDPDAGTMSALVGIPEGTRVAVMRGTVDSQIESARTAAGRAHDVSGGDYAGAFVYDCACRDIILGEAFDTAVAGMREELDAPFVGFETYGEMNMSFGRTSGFHNSTTVISLLPE